MITNINKDIFTIDTGPNLFLGIDLVDNIILFDTGLDESTARKIDKAVGKPVSLICNTHSHADHIGGNFYFQKKYNSSVFIDPKELSFIYLTALEPSLLFGGYNNQFTKSRFLCAKPSFGQILDISRLNNYGIYTIEIPGHSPGLTAFMKDKILYIGDGLFSEEIINKYKILYLYNPKDYANSLKKIEETDFDLGVISHKGLLTKDNLYQLININKHHLQMIKSIIYDLIEYNTTEEIMDLFIIRLDINLSPDLYLLILSTLKGYLSWLLEEEVIEQIFDKRFMWKRK
ncbi:MAG: MBL fold metallo-hydrolase [Deferribacterales bacterium]